MRSIRSTLLCIPFNVLITLCKVAIIIPLYATLINQHAVGLSETNYATQSSQPISRHALNNDSTIDVLVVGGGIAGSAVSLKLFHLGVDFVLAESDATLGGKIVSKSNHSFQWEEGPHTFRPTKIMIDFISDLNLENDLVLSDTGLSRYVLWNKELITLHSLPRLIFREKYLSPVAKLQLLIGYIPLLLFPSRSMDSVEDFYTRIMGKENFEKLIDPFISGIYAGDPAALSARILETPFRLKLEMLLQFSQNLVKLINQYLHKLITKSETTSPPLEFNILKGMQCSFQKGLHQIFDAVTTVIGQEKVLLNHQLTDLGYQDGIYVGKFNTPKGIKYVKAKTVILAVPAYDAAKFSKQFIGLDAYNAINSIRYAPVGVVTVAYTNDSSLHPLNGFGYLIPKHNQLQTLGVIWYSSIFPNKTREGYQIITAIVGGSRNPDSVNLNDTELTKLVDKELRIGFLKEDSPKPIVLGIKRWKHAIPQPSVGYDEKKKIILSALEKQKGLYFIGDYISGVSLGAIINYSYKIAKKVTNSLNAQTA